MSQKIKYLVDLVCENKKCGCIMEIHLRSGEPLCDDYICPECGDFIDATRAVSSFDLMEDEIEFLN